MELSTFVMVETTIYFENMNYIYTDGLLRVATFVQVMLDFLLCLLLQTTLQKAVLVKLGDTPLSTPLNLSLMG